MHFIYFHLSLFLLFPYHSRVKRKPIIGDHSSHLSKTKKIGTISFTIAIPESLSAFSPYDFTYLPLSFWLQFSLYLNLWPVFSFLSPRFFHLFSYQSKEKTHVELTLIYLVIHTDIRTAHGFLSLKTSRMVEHMNEIQCLDIHIAFNSIPFSWNQGMACNLLRGECGEENDKGAIGLCSLTT